MKYLYFSNLYLAGIFTEQNRQNRQTIMLIFFDNETGRQVLVQTNIIWFIIFVFQIKYGILILHLLFHQSTAYILVMCMVINERYPVTNFKIKKEITFLNHFYNCSVVNDVILLESLIYR